MTEKDGFDDPAGSWMERLQKEGFTDLKVQTIEPGEDPKHTHEYYTVNVILSGKLTITDRHGSNTYGPGDRVDTPAGTTHKAKGGSNSGSMIQGYKK